MTYSYDGLGNRVEKSNGTLYWFGMGSEALEETDLSGNLKNDYVFFGGKRIARHTATANYFYIEDHLGSSRVITDASGNKCYDADFYPFGGELAFTNTCAQNYKFTGKERDAETGNDNFGARYYSSSFGRFLSPDWSAIPEPVPYANLTNPQTLNLYQYVEDDPETYADLDGHTDSGENGQNNNKSAQTSTTTCGQAALDATSGCTTTKVNAANPAPTSPQQPAQQQNNSGSQPNQQPSSASGGPRTPVNGPPNTKVKYPNGTEREFGPDGKAVKDIDNGHPHDPEPHAHDWDHSGPKPQRGGRRDLTPEEKQQMRNTAKKVAIGAGIVGTAVVIIKIAAEACALGACYP